MTVRDAVDAGQLPGPRIKASQQIISVYGGLGDRHPTHMFHGDQERRSPLNRIITGPWEARNVVRPQVEDGVDWIKIEASGSGLA